MTIRTRSYIICCLLLMMPLQIHAQRLTEMPSKYIQAVDEYRPAPGQFVNLMPQYEDGDNAATMLQKVNNCIANNQRTDICLGGYGGYVTFHFDHSIANVKGQNDVLILGNCSYDGNSEPGIVMVSMDENGNGLPDDKWYELSGSADADSIGKVLYGYSITYKRPDREEGDGTKSDVSKDITIEQYIPWTDSQGQSGYIYKNRYHAQSYYPQWVQGDGLTFGPHTLLPQNGRNTGNYAHENWVRSAYGWGYVDNRDNADSAACSFNFDHAVEVVSRQPVELPFVDFIRVYTGVNQYCGWIGDTSTEVRGAEDLHLEASVALVKELLAGVSSVKSCSQTPRGWYSLEGIPLTAPRHGVNLLIESDGTVKKIFIQ